MTTNTSKTKAERRAEALQILEAICRFMASLNADFYYIALHEAGFTDEEKVRYVGGGFKTAKANGWIIQTPYSKPSRRNRGNLLNIYKSNVCGFYPDNSPIDVKDIQREYDKWERAGLMPYQCDELAKLWVLTSNIVNAGSPNGTRKPNMSANLFSEVKTPVGFGASAGRHLRTVSVNKSRNNSKIQGSVYAK